MFKLAVVAGLVALACAARAPDIDESRLVGTWTGRIERPGLDQGRRMAQVGTAEFSADHSFVCHFETPEQQPLSEQGTWTLQQGRLSITTGRADGKEIEPKVETVAISHQPLEMRLPVRSGAWFLVLRPATTSP